MPKRKLTSDEIMRFQRLCTACRRAATRFEREGAEKDRRDFLRRCRDSGVSLRSLARAAGKKRTNIRKWLRPPPTAPKPPVSGRFFYPPVLPTDPKPRDSGFQNFEFSRMEPKRFEIVQETRFSRFDFEDRRNSWARLPPLIHVLTGDAGANGNRLGREMASIRKIFTSRLCVEHSEVRPDELTRLISNHSAPIVHFAFHSVPGAVVLADGGRFIPTNHRTFADALRDAQGPRLLVLNGCHGETLEELLSGWAAAIIYWPEITDDESTLTYAESLYRKLHEGENLGQAHRAARAQISTCPEGQLPILRGADDWYLS